MSVALEMTSAVDARNQFVDVNGRRIAYRSIGAGQPLILCVRFRGNMDSWDPAFLDALASNGFRVITFDYTGLGLSTGAPTYNPIEMAKDARDLIRALDLTNVVLAGWSLGGLAAQAALALYPSQISHLVLIGTGPPGPHVKRAEQLFYDTASKAVNDLEDNAILFFEPKSARSRTAAARSAKRIAARTRDQSRPIPLDFALSNLGDKPKDAPFPADFVLDALKTTNVPILHVGGDHDIVFPVENWYALNGQLPTTQFLTYPSAGHGPQHEYPEATADHIASFVRTTA